MNVEEYQKEQIWLRLQKRTRDLAELREKVEKQSDELSAANTDLARSNAVCSATVSSLQLLLDTLSDERIARDTGTKDTGSLKDNLQNLRSSFEEVSLASIPEHHDSDTASDMNRQSPPIEDTTTLEFKIDGNHNDNLSKVCLLLADIADELFSYTSVKSQLAASKESGSHIQSLATPTSLNGNHSHAIITRLLVSNEESKNTCSLLKRRISKLEQELKVCAESKALLARKLDKLQLSSASSEIQDTINLQTRHNRNDAILIEDSGSCNGNDPLACDTAVHGESKLKEPEVLDALAKIKQGYTCKVCLERPISIVLTACGHPFCDTCVENMLATRSRRCPSCATRFSTKSVVRLYL